ncbi:MAG: hypothetical protein ACK5V3_12615 [Bdellovibrionales bacterium]
MKQFIIFLLFSHFTILIQAAGLSGPEWTFTNEELIKLGRIKDVGSQHKATDGHDHYQSKMLKLWKTEIQRACPSCTVKLSGSFFSAREIFVSVSENIWFKITRDPWVLEVTASPMDFNTFSKNSEFFQKLIWDTARKIGLTPHSRIGGGHIHLDIKSYFGEDRNLFRNFIVDLANHPELFLGALGFDLLNAPPMAVLSKNQMLSFEKVLSDFDNGQMSLNDFISRIRTEVYNQTFYDPYPHQQHNPDKYQAVNHSHPETIELRGLNPQASAEIYRLMLQLFEARIEYLKKYPGLIAYNKLDYSSFVSTYSVRKMEFHISNLDQNRILNRTRSYIEETGLPWSEYSALVNNNLSKVETRVSTCKSAVSP